MKKSALIKIGLFLLTLLLPINPAVAALGASASEKDQKSQSVEQVNPEAELVGTQNPRFMKPLLFETFFRDDQVSPKSGAQSFEQRKIALERGLLQSLVPASAYWPDWANAKVYPTRAQLLEITAAEAKIASKLSFPSRPIGLVIGDSIAQFLPMSGLPRGRVWLNAGISGDTTHDVLSRMEMWDEVKIQEIYLHIGENDLENDVNEDEIVKNVGEILHYLKAKHAESNIFLVSVLPTRISLEFNKRVNSLNSRYAALAREESIQYLDTTGGMLDEQGLLKDALTFDGVHLVLGGDRVFLSNLFYQSDRQSDRS